jgi:hypothetical protein
MENMKDASKETVERRLKEGWINSMMMIEVLAVTKDAAKSALEKHIEKMEKEDKTIIYKKDFKEIKQIKKPLKNIKVAYSHIVELELLTRDYEKLVYLVMNYAPSSIEILGPENIKMDMGEAQGILNSLAELIHKFAAAGLGGILIQS